MEQAERQGFDERQGSDVLRLGALEVRPRDGLATVGGRALTLSVREFGLLVAFVRSGGRHRAPRGPLPRGLGRSAALRRPLDRRLRPQAAREARGGASRARAGSTPTWASATASTPSPSHPFHTTVTALQQADLEPMRASSPSTTRSTPLRSTKVLAVGCTALLAVGVAACGSEQQQFQRLVGQLEQFRVAEGRHDQRRRRHVPGARLQRVGRPLQGRTGHDRQLPGHRLGRRHRAVHRRHGRLRRHRRRR